jgi:uncharacterized protein with NRDE domain
MCTLFILFNKIPQYPITIISNRDEMQDRPSLSLQGWDKELLNQGKEIFAPRDEAHKGTWFGFLNKEDHKFAALTNIRDPLNKQHNKLSRGKIILDFLNYSHSPKMFIQELKNKHNEYNPFNLIFGNKNECFYFHSKTKQANLIWNRSQKKEKIYGLSNGKINSNWPKVQNTIKNLSQTTLQHPKIAWNYLKQEMQNKQKYSLRDLPITGVSSEIEEFLSSLFIQNEIYGTRSSLFFSFNPFNQSTFLFEQNYHLNGTVTKETEIIL